MKKRETFLVAAVAGISMGVSAPAPVTAEEKKDDVRCFGVNSCGQHAKCAVSDDDLNALRNLLGGKEYEKRFGNSVTHGCGAHAKCGAESRVANWVATSVGECSAEGGFVVSGEGKKKVAKKA